jgi:Tol biopolymer transport system component
MTVTGGDAPDFALRKTQAQSEVAWSADGERLAILAFDYDLLQNNGIYIARPNGSHPRRILTRTLEDSTSLEWSRDGRWILVADGDIWLIQSDGGNLRRVVKTKAVEESASWVRGFPS